MTPTEKLQAMADALWPLLREKLLAEQSASAGVTKARAGTLRGRKRDTLTRTMYLPELDYQMAMYSLRNERRQALYDAAGKIRIHKAYDPNNAYCITVRGGETEKVIVPTGTLRIQENMLNILYRHDFRCEQAKTTYCAGLTDERGMKVPRTASAYTMDLTLPITHEIIQRTREHWENLEGDTRMVSKVHMVELLDVLEQGQITPYQQINMWRVLVDSNGKTYTYDEAMELHPMAPERLNPRRIVPTWMGDDCA